MGQGISTMQRMAEFLGLPADLTPLAVMDCVQSGLPTESLHRAARAMSPDDTRALEFRIVPKATLTRRRSGHARTLSPEESAKVARIAAVWCAAVDVWKDGDEARRFLATGHPLLHGRTPMDVVLGSELGKPIVEGILGRLKYGSAA